MNKVLKSVLNEKEDRLIDKPNIQSLYICATNAIVPFRLTPSETTILFVCASFSEKNGTSITVGNDYLEEKTGFTQNTIGKAKKGLMAKGLLVREGFGNFGVAKYRLNLPGHHMYVDPKQTAKITPLPTSYQEEENEVQQTSPAPQEVQVQVQQVQQAAPAAQQVQQAAPAAQQVQQVQQIQVQVQVQQVQQAAPPLAAPQHVQDLEDIFDEQAAAIVESTVSHPLDQNIQPIEEEIERRIKLLLCAKRGNEAKQQPTSGFSAIGRRLNLDEHEIVYLWSHPVKFEDVCKIYQNGIPEQKRPELTAISSDLVTELPF